MMITFLTSVFDHVLPIFLAIMNRMCTLHVQHHSLETQRPQNYLHKCLYEKERAKRSHNMGRKNVYCVYMKRETYNLLSKMFITRKKRAESAHWKE